MIPLCILAIENDDDREFMTNIYNQYQRLIYQTTYPNARPSGELHHYCRDPYSLQLLAKA